MKPDNIILVQNEFKLADFGFAEFQARGPDQSLPETSTRGGTNTYGMDQDISCSSDLP